MSSSVKELLAAASPETMPDDAPSENTSDLTAMFDEINNLPEEDRRRLRRKQRLYLEEWVHLVNELRADLSDSEARTVVHAVIGAIQSPLFHNTGLAEDRLRVVLSEAARAILGVTA